MRSELYWMKHRSNDSGGLGRPAVNTSRSQRVRTHLCFIAKPLDLADPRRSSCSQVAPQFSGKNDSLEDDEDVMTVIKMAVST